MSAANANETSAPPRGATLAHARVRYACAAVGRGGIAFDLETGHYWSLNETAAFICARLLDAPEEQLVVTVSERFALAPHDASAAIVAVLASFKQPGIPPSGPFEEFAYRKVGDGYVLHHHETELVRVEVAAGRPIAARLCDPGARRFAPADLIRLVGPKILQASGVGVLHAAALELPDGLLAFSGRSGAGKSTTARLYGEATGAPRFADDLLVVSERDGVIVARAGADRAFYAFCEEAGRRLAVRPHEPVDLAPLVAAAVAPAELVPIAEIVLLARERRRGTAFVLTRLPPEAALEELLGGVFLGGADPESIRRFLALAAAIARTVPVARAEVPDGLPALAAAVTAQTSKIASKP